ncbi:MAG: hypothetical protein K0S34_967 [Bacillales bacterium]|jgi:hypothetical protein|nr:hypothetical protein [Bacillales bacterium]
MIESCDNHDIKVLENRYRLTFESNERSLSTEIISLLDPNNLYSYFESLRI